MSQILFNIFLFFEEKIKIRRIFQFFFQFRKNPEKSKNDVKLWKFPMLFLGARSAPKISTWKKTKIKALMPRPGLDILT